MTNERVYIIQYSISYIAKSHIYRGWWALILTFNWYDIMLEMIQNTSISRSLVI